MTNRTRLTIIYNDNSEVEIELASDSSLTEGEGLRDTTVGARRDLLRMLDAVDRFLRGNGIKKLEFEEEEE